VFNTLTGTFEPNLPIPRRTGNGSGGAAFLDAFGNDPSCSPADLGAPFGVIDLGDIDAFIGAFNDQDLAADIASPFGVLDLTDIDAFIEGFFVGCPSRFGGRRSVP